jgi:hypothetical protein
MSFIDWNETLAMAGVVAGIGVGSSIFFARNAKRSCHFGITSVELVG